MLEQYLWTEKYRPKSIKDTILPPTIKQQFTNHIGAGNLPNMLLHGGAGVGKTTIAKAACEELEADYIVVNGSMNGNIDTLRTTILSFVTTVSFSGGRKYVILDEADALTALTQEALRNFMEEYASNAGFILTANFPNKIIKPLHSRCAVVEFRIDKSDLPKIAGQVLRRVCTILDTEAVPYDKGVVAEVVKRHMPDWRRIINELQHYSGTGKIDSGILAKNGDANINELFSILEGKKWPELRRWVAENIDMGANIIFRAVFDRLDERLKKECLPEIIVLLARYDYQGQFCVDQEVNLLAALTEVMVAGVWK
jgi:DNA polymerase III delta prime subunit